MRRRHATLFTLMLLAGLIAVPLVLTWRQVRQEHLDQTLIVAVEHNDIAAARRLLMRGADPNAQVLPDDKRSVWKRMLDMLRHGSVPAAVPEEGVLAKAIDWYPSAEATDAGRDNTALINVLLDAGAKANRRLIRINSYDPSRAEKPRTVPIVAAARKGKWKAVQALLAHHVDVNATDDYGNTVLMYAVWRQDTQLVETLLKRGANVNAKDDCGETALFWICHIMEYGRHDGTVWMSYMSSAVSIRGMVACLIRHGASVGGKDSDGKTILQRAQEEWHDRQLIHMLKLAGAQ